MNLATVVDLIFLLALGMGGYGGWLLNKRIEAFQATIPHFRAEIEKLNAGIAAAQATLVQMRAQAAALESGPGGADRDPIAPTSLTAPRSPLGRLMAAMAREHG